MGPPRIIIAAAHSGAGKTTIALALARALRRCSRQVATFKAGPDFLDPTYLSRASGRSCYNLDTWMMGNAYVVALLEQKSRDVDISVIEGVMGLFDGASPDTMAGSTAEIAVLTRTPVLLLVNAHGMARSIAALVKGYAEFDPHVWIAGVIANHVGSAGHAEVLAAALHAAGLPELVGAVPRGAFSSLPSRHLGLVAANQEILGEKTLDALADALQAHVDVDRIIDLAQTAGDLNGVSPMQPERRRHSGVRLALAKDAAFHFYYADMLEALEDVGFTLVPFSPLTDNALPAGVDALFMGGGYPELHAAELARNAAMRQAVRKAARSGMPIYAECGGLMYLSEAIIDLHGKSHRMCGVLPFGTRMRAKRKTLGYVEVALRADSLWGPSGATARGHAFHYSELTADPAQYGGLENVYTVTPRRSGAVQIEGFCKANVLASYAHLHLASQPETLGWFYTQCAHSKRWRVK